MTNNPTIPPQDPQLEKLRQILFATEKKELESLHQRLDDFKGVSAEEVAAVLGDSIKISTSKGDEIAQALDTPLNESIKQAARNNPDVFADALYPVISPAIRKSIAETLKNFIASINKTLDHSFSSQGLKWRLESIKTGVPFSQIVLRNTLTYRVEQVLLIQPQSGLLIHNITSEKMSERDPDAVSAMLTAIGDFARDSFMSGKSGSQTLDTIDMGDHTVQLTHGPKAYLACVVMGVPPSSLRDHCRDVLESIHRLYGKVIQDLNSSSTEMITITPMLESCLMSEEKETEKKKSKLSTPFIVFVLMLSSLFFWFSYQEWQENIRTKALKSQYKQLITHLEADPGIVVTRTTMTDEHLMVYGLVDPLTNPPASYLPSNDLSSEQVSFNMSPYHALTPEMIMLRAQKRLNPPETIQMELDPSGTLYLKGEASPEWISKVDIISPYLSGIEQIDKSHLHTDDSVLLAAFIEKYSPPETINATVDNGELILSGNASSVWIDRLKQSGININGLVRTDTKQVQPSEEVEFARLTNAIRQTRLLFNENVELTDESEDKIISLVDNIRSLHNLGEKLNKVVQITIIGKTDGRGSKDTNIYLANARAYTINELLLRYELPEELFRLKGEPSPYSSQNTINQELRRVEFSIQ